MCMLQSVSAAQFPLPTDGDIIGEVQTRIALHEDTFADIGKALDFGYLEMVAANPYVDAWLPGEGVEITLPSKYILPAGARSGIVMNLAEYRLYYYPKDKPVVYTFPLGIGREGWSSPISETRIVMKTPNPGWTPPKSILREHEEAGDPLPAYVPPGPDNPLGPYKMTLALPGYLIHGSNKKFGIGMRVSHGCFRMLNHNVLELAGLVQVGESVRIINEPYKLGFKGKQLYLEAHTPLDDHGQPSVVDKHAMVMQLLLANEGLQDRANIDWDRLREVVAEETGIPEVIGELI
ncbi:L,D-transpeptidase family protein [Thiopseudomonas acetoxidans]|uniref:L,D-transpeptidase family protein n=1 Tax=Thiopseudomonas acetoxidans TaxID=3041622 RepID=A0ABT7SRC0_9GAMM|nr:L,D-transpeptidase family protein [Thiopseudomonas sp. CY1220]MDM7858074.1 L,D-transpeptidase family protein [Thiopseudomonas sp. CY1220]